MRKMHKGLSKSYDTKKTVRKQRVGDRAVQKIAKELIFEMIEGTLDQHTESTFKWIKGRPTASEKELQ